MNWRFMARLWSLQRSQWYSAERLRLFQERRLRALITHAFAQSPYYRWTFDAAGITPTDIRGLNDLAALPVLRRQDVHAHHDDIVAANARRFHPTPGKTSGTTGGRLEFLRDRDSLNVGNAALWRFRGWHGIGLGHRVAEIRGAEFFRFPSGALDYETVSRLAPNAQTLQVNLTSPDPGRRAAVAQELARFKPDAIRTGRGRPARGVGAIPQRPARLFDRVLQQPGTDARREVPLRRLQRPRGPLITTRQTSSGAGGTWYLPVAKV